MGYSVAVKAGGYFKIPENDAKALETVIATFGPVSVAVAANWWMYGGGIFADGCGESCTINHGVVAVGYDIDYWLIRNSWGNRWGEQGYIKLSRKYDQTTFENNDPSVGVACKP